MSIQKPFITVHFCLLLMSLIPAYAGGNPPRLNNVLIISIDDYLSSLINSISDEKNYLIIITSDHAGHEKIHGGHHPEDYRLPLVVSSDVVSVKRLKNISFSVVDVKKMIEDFLQNES